MAAAAAAKDDPQTPAARLVALPSTSRSQTERLRREGRRLEATTMAWNTGEVVATLTLGYWARSLALVAFGLDSLVEVFASFVVLWHLGGLAVSGRSQRARRLVSAGFFVIGLYLGAAGIHGLATHAVPAHSPAGIGVLGASVAAMIVLARAKRRIGLALPSPPLVASATMTLLDGVLATGVLVALLLDLTMGWWWADPVAALAVAVLAIAEGLGSRRDRSD